MALGNYSSGAWEWYGPFHDNHVRLSTGARVAGGTSYLSGLGNLFICVLAYDGARVNVVGVGADSFDALDTAPPPVPGGLTAQPVAGGLDLQWNTVIAWDLDGDGVYEIYGDPAGRQQADTGKTGIIRSMVRGMEGAGCVSCSSVSLIIAGNSRPVASAVAVPSSGLAPLSVTLTGTADDFEDEAAELEYAWDFNGDGVYEPGTDTLTPASQQYNAGLHNIKFRVTDSGGAWDVDTLSVNAWTDPSPANLPPVARLTSSRMYGNAPLIITLDASLSQDLDGSITRYEWDWDSDGVYDFDSGVVAQQVHVWYDPGYYAVTVRVTDDDGATAVDVLPLTACGPHFVRPDYVGDVGSYTTLIAVNGHPAISYHDVTNGNVKFVRANDRFGMEWGTPVTVIDDPKEAGRNNSLCLANNRPAFCYVIGSGVNDLYYVQAVDTNGTAWNTPVLIEDSTPVSYVSLKRINNRPAIAYYVWADEDVRFIRAGDVNGSTWGAGTVAGHVGGGLDADYPCLALAQVNGNPAVAFYDNDSNEMCYVRATDSAGTGWGTPVVVDSTDDVGRYPSLAVVNSKPMVCYHDATNMLLKYARAGDFNGTSWGDPVILDAERYAGRFSSIAIVNNRPAVSYGTLDYDGDWVYNLRYIRALDASGVTWGLPVQLDGELNAGFTPCTAQIDGNPAISYYDRANGNLVYALMVE